MNCSKVNEVLVDIVVTLTYLRHARWMAAEAFSFPPEKLEKKMRWLGFIQGVLWVAGVTTIAAAKEANMPTEEK